MSNKHICIICRKEFEERKPNHNERPVDMIDRLYCYSCFNGITRDYEPFYMYQGYMNKGKRVYGPKECKACIDKNDANAFIWNWIFNY